MLILPGIFCRKHSSLLQNEESHPANHIPKTNDTKACPEYADVSDAVTEYGSYYWDGDDDFSDYDDYYDRVEDYDAEDAYGHWDRDPM